MSVADEIVVRVCRREDILPLNSPHPNGTHRLWKIVSDGLRDEWRLIYKPLDHGNARALHQSRL